MLVDLDPSVVQIGSICTVTLITFIGALFKGSNWLSEKFEGLQRFILDKLDKHEDEDQRRHEDNIQRFAALETIVKNGH